VSGCRGKEQAASPMTHIVLGLASEGPVVYNIQTLAQITCRYAGSFLDLREEESCSKS
jgi:hypothetical protein